jgi:hypothetical protein
VPNDPLLSERYVFVQGVGWAGDASLKATAVSATRLR